MTQNVRSHFAKHRGCLWMTGTNRVFITVTSFWSRWRLKSQAYRLFAQLFIYAHIKENTKAPRHWPLWGESTSGFPSQRASCTENDSIWWRHNVMNPSINTFWETLYFYRTPLPTRYHYVLIKCCPKGVNEGVQWKCLGGSSLPFCTFRLKCENQ